MVINDLSHLAEATKEISVTGGYYYYYRPRNSANADASAVAIGYNTFSLTTTGATVVQGHSSSSFSESFATTY